MGGGAFLKGLNIGATILGTIGSVIGQSKAAKGAKDVYREQKKANEKYRNDLFALQDQLKDQPKLSIDDTAINDLLSYSRGEVATAGAGRIVGEEQARDSVRQSTADAYSRARNAGSSVADLLGFAGSASAGETKAMNELDIKFSQDRQNKIREAKARLSDALTRKITFDQYKEQALFEDERNRFDTEFGFDQFVAGTENDLRMQELAQMGAYKQAQASIWGTAGDALLGTARFANDVSFLEAYKKSLI